MENGSKGYGLEFEAAFYSGIYQFDFLLRSFCLRIIRLSLSFLKTHTLFILRLLSLKICRVILYIIITQRVVQFEQLPQVPVFIHTSSISVLAMFIENTFSSDLFYTFDLN